MLKGISHIISPELMVALMKMGHGDELVIADGNFPADSHAQRIVRCDGHNATVMLDNILGLFPLDTFVAAPATVMQPVDENADEPPIWSQFRELMKRHENREVTVEQIERFEFYERARRAYAIVATTETALYANLILKKGVVTHDPT